MLGAAFLPQFIGSADPVIRKSLPLAGIHYIEGISWFVIVFIAVDQTRRFFLRSVVRRWLDGICGVRLALERR